MKFRNLMLTAVCILAVTASFATKKRTNQYHGLKLGTTCALAPVNEAAGCGINATGPQCTITLGALGSNPGTTYPATQHTSGCTVPVFAYGN